MLTQVSPQWVHVNDGDDDKIIIKIMMIMMTGVSSMGANRGPLSRLPKRWRLPQSSLGSFGEDPFNHHNSLHNKDYQRFFLKEITMIIIIIITITTVMIATKSPGSDRPLWQERTRPGWQGCHKGSHLNHDDHHQHYRDYRDNHYHCHDHNHNHHHASRCSTTPYMTKLATMAILLY